ncbi:MAG: succinate dehydrogenase/fumarate reductase iron-sulfur subunit [Bdellovibrionota bacterium]|jgi:succinate dehydrogenase / fumarate reductase iron-sulfur subunit|nr:succinate dehydrogenase/fumarate reductase iron-sulfur subunit [Bdellovibrionota bacterium]
MSADEKLLTLNLKIWRQKDAKDKGQMVDYTLEGVSTDSSFLEMLDQLNEKLVGQGEEPVTFDHDCREGICGMCSLMINGQAHGPEKETTTCQLHMRSFNDGDTIVIEPWRARAFPVLKDLTVDRSAFDEIIMAGGYVNVNTGNAQDANEILIPKESADLAMDAAACIGCAACVASCKNASAMLFVGAKISQLALLPQGQVEAEQRAANMVAKMDELGFGNCTNEAECEASCPKGINISNIARMNKEFLKSAVKSKS